MGQPTDLNGKNPPKSIATPTSEEPSAESSADAQALPALDRQEPQEAASAATKKHYSMRADTIIINTRLRVG